MEFITQYNFKDFIEKINEKDVSNNITYNTYINEFIKVFEMHLKINTFKENIDDKIKIMIYIFILTNDIKYYNALKKFNTNDNNINDYNEYFYEVLLNINTSTIKDKLNNFKKNNIVSLNDLLDKDYFKSNEFFYGLNNLKDDIKDLIKNNTTDENELLQINTELNKIKKKESTIINNYILEYNELLNELKTDLNQIDKNSDYDNELIKIEETIKKNKLGLFDKLKKEKKQENIDINTKLTKLKEIVEKLILCKKEYKLSLTIKIIKLQLRLIGEKQIDNTIDADFDNYTKLLNEIKTKYISKFNKIISENKDFKLDKIIEDLSNINELVKNIDDLIKTKKKKNEIDSLNKLTNICLLLQHINVYTADTADTAQEFYNSQITIAYYEELIETIKPTPINYYDELDTDTIRDNLLVYAMHLYMINNNNQITDYNPEKIIDYFKIYDYDYNKTEGFNIDNIIKAYYLILYLFLTDNAEINKFFEAVSGSEQMQSQ